MMLYFLFFVAGILPAYAAAFYFLVLACARCVGACERREASVIPKFRFTIVIPAHDEEAIVGATIRSCKALDYPEHLLKIVVVADNCQDDTNQVAAQLEVEVWERDAPTERGKGQALSWAFDRLLKSEPSDRKQREAVIVLDADCRIEARACRVLDQFLRHGAKVVQTNHVVSNPDASPISFAAAVGRTLEYDLGFAPKSRLGLSVMLVGTGMVFDRDVLDQCVWQSESSAEDTEYTVRLVNSGHRVRFASNASIICASAESEAALTVQRTRWAQGNLSQGKSKAAQLMLQGLWRGDLIRFDLGWSLLIASRPLVILHAAAVIVFALFGWLVRPSVTSSTWLRTSLGIVPLYAFYFLIGIAWLGITPKRFKLLLGTPAVLTRLVAIAVGALFNGDSAHWTKTPREHEQT